MDIEWVRQYCLSLPYTTEQIQWGNDLLFKVGGKMFAGVPLEPAPVFLTVKADHEEFAELIERQGVIPAPYLARAKWVAIENEGTLPRSEVLRLVSKSYELVFANLTKKLQTELAAKAIRKSGGPPPKRRTVVRKIRAHKKGSKK